MIRNKIREITEDCQKQGNFIRLSQAETMKICKEIENICAQTGMKCGFPCWDKCPVHKTIN